MPSTYLHKFVRLSGIGDNPGTNLAKRVLARAPQKIKNVHHVIHAAYKHRGLVYGAPKAIKMGYRNRFSIARKAMKGKGLVFPGARYIGPGNPLQSGRPTSHADHVARAHDYHYDYLIKKGKNPYFTYNEPDRIAIKRVKNHLHTPSGAAVWMGLSAKRIFRRERSKVPSIPAWAPLSAATSSELK